MPAMTVRAAVARRTQACLAREKAVRYAMTEVMNYVANYLASSVFYDLVRSARRGGLRIVGGARRATTPVTRE